MKKAVVYARYSSDSQTEQSIEGQVRVCNEYAEKNRIEILDYYIDRAMTGTNDNRPDFKRMLEDSKKKKWDHVLVYKFDRFSRNKYESVIHKKALKDLGISVVSATELIPEAPEGIILESLLEGMNQYYSAELSQKVKRGLRETRIKGLYQGGTRPYGYRLENRKLCIDENEASVVRYIFKYHVLGLAVPTIARRLRKRGVRCVANKLITVKDVHKILRREYYTGLYSIHGEYFNNIYPPIISRNMYKRSASRRRFYVSPLNKEVYVYRNKITCKKCGADVRVDCGGANRLMYYRYYACVNKKRNLTCDLTSHRKDFFEDYLKLFIRTFISEPSNIDLISKILLSKYKQEKNLEQLQQYENEKSECQVSLQNLVHALERGIYTDTTNERIKFLEKRIIELDAEIFYEKNKDHPKYSKTYIKKYFSDSLKLNDLELANLLINKMVLDDDTLEIYLHCPYDDSFTTFTLIKKVCFEKTYKSGWKIIHLSKDISVFI